MKTAICAWTDVQCGIVHQRVRRCSVRSPSIAAEQDQEVASMQGSELKIGKEKTFGGAA
jgi:hypothetical protein